MTKAQLAKYGFENPFKTDPLVKRASRYCKGTKVLDVGCGEGADSVFFAKKGFTVTSIDMNRTFLSRFRAFRRDSGLSNVRILSQSALTYAYPASRYDVVLSILVLCCMKRSECERTVRLLKKSVKPGGIMIISARNYRDPERKDYMATERMVEPNTFKNRDTCAKHIYFIEKGRLRELFSDCEVLYYFEGYAPCKYNQHPKHGDSYLICRRRV